MTMALIEAGDLAGAQGVGAAALARCRDAGDVMKLPQLVMMMADLDLRAGRIKDAAAQVREGLQIAVRAGNWVDVFNGLWSCGLVCMAAGRYAETVTVWAASDALSQAAGLGPDGTPEEERRRQQALRKAGQALGAARARAAEDRGAAMSLATAAEYALIAHRPRPGPAPGGGGGEAERPGTGTGHPGRPGPHRRRDRRPAVHLHPDRPLAPGPDPGQDRLPPPR